MSCDVPLDEVVYFDAITALGAAVDADTTPTFAVYEEATDTDIGVGGNMTKRTSLTGNYRGSFTASAANGFELGKWYVVIGSATVAGVATKAVLMHFRIVAAEAVVGVSIVDTKYVTGTLQTAGDIYAYLTTNLGALGANLSAIPKTGFKLASDGLAQVTAWTVAITGNITGNLSGSVGSVSSFGTLVADVASAVWSATTRILTAGTNIVLAKGTGVTGFNDLSAAQVNTEADTALADVGVTTTITGRIDVATSTRASQTSVDDLPTNAELATALGTADDAVLAAVAAVPTTEEIAAAILDTPENLLVTNADGSVNAAATLSEETIGDIAEAVAAEVPTASQIAAALSGQVTLTGPVYSDGGLLILVEGDDYVYDEGKKLEWTISTTQTDWTDATADLRLQVTVDDETSSVSVPGTVVDESGPSRRVRFDMTAAQHADLLVGKGKFQIAITRDNANVGTEVHNGVLIREEKVA